MPLANVNLAVPPVALPADIRVFLREARRRIARAEAGRRIPSFVPSDFRRTYAALRALVKAELAPGDLFCEWGSGFGVVACLAAMLGFDAFGIEIEGELVDEARQLAEDFGLSVEFVHGSFIPPGGAALVEAAGRLSWLTPSTGDAYEELGLDAADFGTIFAYPWPDEERLIADLFEQGGAVGAMLLTYDGLDGIRLREKTGATPAEA